ERIARGGALPLSYAQQRLWFLDQLEPSTAYHVPIALRLHGALDTGALGRAIGEIVRRHEVLRSTFAPTADGVVQLVIHPPSEPPTPVVDLDIDDAGAEAAITRFVAAAAARPFDLSRGPLLRTEILRVAPDDHVLVATMHHIASDAWSMDVLVSELAALYPAI